MGTSKAEITLKLTPKARLDIIDVTKHLREECDDPLSGYKKALYCSHHTTAGYFEQSLCARLKHSSDSLRAFVQAFQRLFPPNANYYHDRLHLRTELNEENRCEEPRNADSHLTFIGSGLANSVTYANNPETPVYLIDLDGVHDGNMRRRQTTVIGYTREEWAGETRLAIPVSSHSIDSINLKDPRLGLFEQLQEFIEAHGIVKGRIDMSLAGHERHAGLTVNEYETLLMKHDLAEVLRNPFRFMAEKGRHMLRDPRAIPSKAKNYAKYDFVHFVNEFLDILGLSESLVEKVVDKFMAVPAGHFMRMKRSVSLPICDPNGDGRGSIVEGPYQSPILVQWEKAQGQERQLKFRLIRFE